MKSLRRFGKAIELSSHRVRMEFLSEAFRGFRIVQLSDIHHGVYLPSEALREAVEKANRLEPDLAVLTGDFVTLSRGYIGSVAEVLGRLEARYGTFAVLGNHDFRVGAEEIARALRRAGIAVLRNRHTVLRRRGAALFLAGVDDLHHQADLPRALRGICRPGAIILLSHNPGIIRAAAHAGVGLMLSGHTHGGQVHLPVVGTIYGRSPEQLRFKVGWARLGPTQIYVSRGIGTVVVPWRYRCPAEMPRFHLEPALRPAEGARRPIPDPAR